MDGHPLFGCEIDWCTYRFIDEDQHCQLHMAFSRISDPHRPHRVVQTSPLHEPLGKFTELHGQDTRAGAAAGKTPSFPRVIHTFSSSFG